MIKKLLSPFRELTVAEWCIWLGSLAAVILSFFLCRNSEYLYLTASVLGVTALIFLAKGHVLGQAICIIFSGFYGYISYTFRYYGEMITYLGLTAPMAIVAFITWMKNPHKRADNRTEVTVNRIPKKEHVIALIAGIAIAVAFYFILDAFQTPNLAMSTVSVLTSFLAVYYTARRSPLYAVWYAANDVVLIVLWSLASAQSLEYVSMVVCFSAFFINDIYGFIQWLHMKKRQAAETNLQA